MPRNLKIDLTYDRARAIMRSADIVWSEMDEQANDPDWKGLVEEVKQRFPNLAKEYAYL